MDSKLENSYRLLSKGFQDLDDWSYYLRAWHGRSRFEKIKELLRNERNARILDVGCGDGFFLREIEPHAEKFGIDIIDIQNPNDFSFIRANLEDGFPFESESFDTLIAGEMIEHLLKTDYFINECHRILRKNGCLILTTPNLCSLKNSFLVILGRQPIGVDYSLDNGVGHVRAFSPAAMREILKRGNFQIEILKSDRVPLPFAPPNSDFFLKIEQKLADLFRRWGNILIVKARKQ